MKLDEALGVWGMMAASVGGRPLDEAELGIRAGLILDVPAELGREVALDLAQRSTFLPSVGQYLDAVAIRRDGPAPAPADVIAELLAAVRVRGWIDPPPPGYLSAVAEEALAAMGGWVSFCEGDEMVNRAHLVKLTPPLIERDRRRRLATDAELDPPAPPPELDA